MDSHSTSSEISWEIPFLFRIYKDGRVERFSGTETVPPSTDPETGVQSKDVVISPEKEVSARLFLPKTTIPNQKLPLLIYIHGGAFCIETPFSPQYTGHLNAVTAEANVIAVSVHYRKAPEHPLPTAYDDTWDAVKWVASHTGGDGAEPWLKDFADFGRVFLAGDSAGANLAHYVAVRAGVEKLEGVNIRGLVAVHPFFLKDEQEQGDKLLDFIFPTSGGLQDPRLNPAVELNLARLGCRKVVIMVAERDFLRERGWKYYETLKKSAWDGEVEIVETEGEEHVFHLKNPSCEKALQMKRRFVSFINQN